MKSLTPQESVRKDDGVDDEAVTTRFFTDFAEVIQQNMCREVHRPADRSGAEVSRVVGEDESHSRRRSLLS